MPEFDIEQIDHVLTTTRAVRRKLDLDRPVEIDLLLRMIDIAEQAPSGSNQASRRWIIVCDPAQKRRVADLYREIARPGLAGLVDTARRADSRGARVMSSALFLAENLERVPALVLATIYGIHDGGGTPSLFDSVIQAAWSFCLAGRARGLGTAWTTMHLQRASEVGAILGIPDGVTQIVLLPVAYTATTDFHPAPRRPAAEITYIDHWGFSPSDVPTERQAHPGDGRGVSLDLDIAATPERLWPLISDITLPGKFSTEAVTATWTDPETAPGAGSEFTGTNHLGDTETTGHPEIDRLVNQLTEGGTWQTTCRITEWRPNREFAYTVADANGKPSAHWRFTLQPLIGGNTRVTHQVRVGPGISGSSLALMQAGSDPQEIITGRFLSVRENIARTLNGIRRLAEQSTR